MDIIMHGFSLDVGFGKEQGVWPMSEVHTHDKE
jgi:hypothetical protein